MSMCPVARDRQCNDYVASAVAMVRARKPASQRRAGPPFLPCLCFQFSLSWRTSWGLTACRYEQLTPPVARLAPPRSSSLGIWAPGMRAAGAARRASGLCRVLCPSPRAGAWSCGRAGKPAGGASATIGQWDLIAI